MSNQDEDPLWRLLKMNLNFAWRSSFKVVQSCLTTNGYKVLDHSCHCGWRDYSRLLWRFKSHKGELYCPITFSMSIKDGSESTGAIDCPVHSVSTHVVDDPHPESWSAADVWSASDAHLRLAVLCARHLRAADAAQKKIICYFWQKKLQTNLSFLWEQISL